MYLLIVLAVLVSVVIASLFFRTISYIALSIFRAVLFVFQTLVIWIGRSVIALTFWLRRLYWRLRS